MFYYFNFKELSDTEINEAYSILYKAKTLTGSDKINFTKKKELINTLEPFVIFQQLIDDCNKYIHESMWYEVDSRICFGEIAFYQEMAKRFHKNYLDN